MSQPRQPAPRIRYVVAGMIAGAIFLLLSCGLLGWSYLVSPVPRTVALVAVALGALSATTILVATLLFSLASAKHRQE